MKRNTIPGLAFLIFGCAPLAYAENTLPQLPRVNMTFCQRNNSEEVECSARRSDQSRIQPIYVFYATDTVTELTNGNCDHSRDDCEFIDKVIYRFNSFGRLEFVTETNLNFVGDNFRRRNELEQSSSHKHFNYIDSRTGKVLNDCIEELSSGYVRCTGGPRKTENEIKDKKSEKFKFYTKRFNTLKREFNRFYKPN